MEGIELTTLLPPLIGTIISGIIIGIGVWTHRDIKSRVYDMDKNFAVLTERVGSLIKTLEKLSEIKEKISEQVVENEKRIIRIEAYLNGRFKNFIVEEESKK